MTDKNISMIPFYFKKKIVLIKAGQDGAILQAEKLRRLTIPPARSLNSHQPQLR